jgi:DNA-binding CsgD family transcriptional regulator
MRFTPLEIKVLNRLRKPNETIKAELGISIRQVTDTLADLYTKTRTDSRRSLIEYWDREGPKYKAAKLEE